MVYTVTRDKEMTFGNWTRPYIDQVSNQEWMVNLEAKSALSNVHKLHDIKYEPYNQDVISRGPRKFQEAFC